MPKTYSTYEAKARFSEIVRTVRGGQRVTIAYRGEPVAEVVPLKPARQTLDDRFAASNNGASCTPRRRGGGRNWRRWHPGRAHWHASSPNETDGCRVR